VAAAAALSLAPAFAAVHRNLQSNEPSRARVMSQEHSTSNEPRAEQENLPSEEELIFRRRRDASGGGGTTQATAAA